MLCDHLSRRPDAAKSCVVARYLLTVIRISALLGLLVSAPLLLHYVEPSVANFCGAQSGCEAVRTSPLARWSGSYAIPLGGVVGFTGLFWATFFERLRGLVSLGCLVAGGLAIALLGYQWHLGSFCPWCVAADLAALVACCAGYLWRRNSAAPQREPLAGWAWTCLFGLALNAATVWQKLHPEGPLPPRIAELQRPGVLNVVEFVDFQCPHCRLLHPIIKQELKAVTAPVRIQRFHVPLSFHTFAVDAARAAICAERAGKGEEMADRLFALPLYPGVTLDHADALGLSRGQFIACLDATETTEELTRHGQLFHSTGNRQLPLTYIEGQVLIGSGSVPLVHALFNRALRKPAITLSLPVFAALLALLAGLCIRLGWRRQATEAP